MSALRNGSFIILISFVSLCMNLYFSFYLTHSHVKRIESYEPSNTFSDVNVMDNDLVNLKTADEETLPEMDKSKGILKDIENNLSNSETKKLGKKLSNSADGYNSSEMDAKVGVSKVKVIDKGKGNEARPTEDDQLSMQIGLSYHKPLRRIRAVNCEAIIKGDAIEIAKANEYMKKNPKKFMEDKDLSQFAQNCTALKARGYITDDISQEEKDFPLAFSIVMHKEAFQAEMLLRVLYRPQNTYCIHIDAKASAETVNAMETVANCFPNVFLAKEREIVFYAGFARLQAELNCIKESMEWSSDWKYYMNYASTMFPLKTNLEMVKILKVYNGTNDINGKSPVRVRTRFSYKLIGPVGKKRLVMTKILKSKPPLGLNITKGSIYAIFTRDFCKFMLEDSVAKILLTWSKDTYSPDEHFAATLHHVRKNEKVLGTRNVPGSYSGPLKNKRWFGTYVKWGRQKNCRSRYSVHSICINGLQTLQNLTSRPEFSANKFLIKRFEPLAWDCMEEWYFNRTFAKTEIDLTFYAKQPFVNNNWMEKEIQ